MGMRLRRVVAEAWRRAPVLCKRVFSPEMEVLDLDGDSLLFVGRIEPSS